MASTIVPIEIAAKNLFLQLNTRYAPTLELLRRAVVYGSFDPENKEDPEDPDEPDVFLVSLRIFDMINKTELRSIFKGRIEWYNDYQTIASKNLRGIYTTILPTTQLVSSKMSKEMLALGIPEPTIKMIKEYTGSEDIVNQVSGWFTVVLLACLASNNNLKLTKRAVEA